MKNMYFLTESVAEKYFEENGTMLSYGVYRIDDDKVVKKIDVQKSQSILFGTKFSYDKLIQFKNIDIQGFSFSKALVYTKLSNIYAVINKYVEGSSINKKSLSGYRIDDVINAIKDLENSIKQLSDLNIAVNDVHNGNIIFDGKKLTMIDTMEYYYTYNNSSLYEYNMKLIMIEIFSDLFFSFRENGYTSAYNIENFFNRKGIRFDNFRNVEYLINPIETLISVKKIMEDDFGIKLNTFGECHQYIDTIISDDFRNKVRKKQIMKL